MAVFENLHDLGTVLAGFLRGRLDPVLSDVLAAPPIENASATTEAVRVSLLWVTPQPTHRNDPWVRTAAGQLEPSPVTLSAFFLVTAYGVTDTGEPTPAINRLGQAIQAFETTPVLDLPLPDDPLTPEADILPGTGKLTVTLIPTAADLMEKIFTPLQMRHRPFALFEVGPVQMARPDPARPAPRAVRPGGVRLTGAEVFPVAPPRIRRMTPVQVRAGGRLRLDTLEAGTAETLRLGSVLLAFADAPASPQEIARPDDEGRVFATCPSDAPAGDFDAVLRGPRAASEPVPFTILPAEAAALDAPLLLPPGADLSLTGAGLAGAERAFIWPDAGMRDPAEVIEVAVTSSTAAQVDLDRADLDAAGLRPGLWRLCLRLPGGRFTPYVLLEVMS